MKKEPPITKTRRREAEAARLAEGVKPELNLTIKGEWLDAILYRGKREEYRSADNRQCLRLWSECESGPVRHFPLRPIVAIFRAGYSMSSRAAAVLVNSIAQREGFRSRWCDGSVHLKPPCEHWGEPREEPHFALGLQHVLTVGSYSFIRDWVATPDAARAVAVARAEIGRDEK